MDVVPARLHNRGVDLGRLLPVAALYLLVSVIIGGWFHGVSVSPLRGVEDMGLAWFGEGVGVASITLNRVSVSAFLANVGSNAV